MFNAYPKQNKPICWKLIVPLSFVGMACLLVYGYFESSAEELSSPDGLKRMHPFLSSQNFEIGFWTRSMPKASAPPLPTESPEFLSLRQALEAERARSALKDKEIADLLRQGVAASSTQLEAERARSAQKDEEIAQLRRGGKSVASSQASVNSPDKDSHHREEVVERDELTTPASIPESLFRGPPQQELLPKDMQAQSSPRGEIAPPVIAPTLPPTSPPAAVVSEVATAPKSNEHQDSTITVKTGGKEIILQIGEGHHQEQAADAAVTAAVATTSRPQAAHTAPKQPLTLDPSNSSSSAERVLAKSISNVTEEQGKAAKPSARKESTQITVKSGEHSVTIELRGSDQGKEAEALAAQPAAAMIAPAQNSTTSPPPTTKPAVQDPPDLPDYVAPAPAQRVATKSGSQDEMSAASAAEAAAEETSETSANVPSAPLAAPAQPVDSSSNDEASSYANLALRAR
eukprot:TRINITY_DN32073_c0_g1_i1.p1 TRINITY_DN32073_c0_g1~~TRINITY_DN32073_c0_g1_i1.p1  ORF type:complete len:460 (+),score=96.90 TRINITY_DN32073_c0_g1_i1:95-1474(+)